MKDLVAGLTVSQDRTYAQITALGKKQEKVMAMQAKTDEYINKLFGLSGRHESFIQNSSEQSEENFRQTIRDNGNRVEDIVFDEVQGNTDRTGIEVDGLLVNGFYAGFLEVKTTLRVNDIEKVARKILVFHRRFKEFKGSKLLVIAAGETVREDARQEVHEQSFAVLTPDGQSVTVDHSHLRAF